MNYKSIANPAEGQYKDRGSKFLAYAFPVSDVNEVKGILDALKKEHHAARHHCYAYRVGPTGEEWRANDDGEPSGSAGRQILASIDSAGLSDVLIVVVRYFGGILLGVPGLIKAYRESSAQSLANAITIEKTATRLHALHFKYEQMSQVRNLLKSIPGATITGQTLELECDLTVAVPLSDCEAFVKLFEKYIKN